MGKGSGSLVVGGVTWTLGAVVPSLDSTSGTPYVVGQCRFLHGTHIRVQFPAIEASGPITDALAKWGATLPGGWKSIASGSTEYNPMQARVVDVDAPSIRVRIPGPVFNRPWGALVVLTGVPTQVARYLTKRLNAHMEADNGEGG